MLLSLAMSTIYYRLYIPGPHRHNLDRLPDSPAMLKSEFGNWKCVQTAYCFNDASCLWHNSLFTNQWAHQLVPSVPMTYVVTFDKLTASLKNLIMINLLMAFTHFEEMHYQSIFQPCVHAWPCLLTVTLNRIMSISQFPVSKNIFCKHELVKEARLLWSEKTSIADQYLCS